MRKITKTPTTTGPGLGLKPGDEHYRAYVGAPENYDLVSAMVFNLLTCCGLRQHHRVLDIGCGSLRNGRLLIPYLNPGNYYGVEPNEWLVKDGILNETGEDLIHVKKPVFSFKNSLEDFPTSLELDFAFAQSVFSHCDRPLIEQWLEQVSFHLKNTGALFATFFVHNRNESDDSGLRLGPEEPGGVVQGWIYPDCVAYNPKTLDSMAGKHGLQFRMLDWAHPIQQWAIFTKPNYDTRFIEQEVINWNHALKTLLGR